MGEAAMMGERKGGTAEAAEHVKIGRFGSQGESEGSQGGLAIESGAPQASAGQEVGDGFQGLDGFYLGGCGNARGDDSRIGCRRASLRLADSRGGCLNMGLGCPHMLVSSRGCEQGEGVW